MPAERAGETWVSVDTEASGPSPSTGSLIAVGACLVDDPDEGFYAEIRPLADRPWHSETELIHGLSRQHLDRTGLEPHLAMAAFAAWLARVTDGRRAVFVAFNATFDWMFVADYFHRFIGSNPFGVSGLDQKAYFMAKHGVTRWAETNKGAVRRSYTTDLAHTHHALDDAREQAELMRQLRDTPVAPPASDGTRGA